MKLAGFTLEQIQRAVDLTNDKRPYPTKFDGEYEIARTGSPIDWEPRVSGTYRWADPQVPHPDPEAYETCKEFYLQLFLQNPQGFIQVPESAQGYSFDSLGDFLCNHVRRMK